MDQRNQQPVTSSRINRAPNWIIKKRFFWLLVSGYWFLSFIPLAHACPLCKEALSKMGEIWTVVGFNWSIYFMIAVPFLLVGAFAGALYWNWRKQHPL
jgi:hypothetical protein